VKIEPRPHLSLTLPLNHKATFFFIKIWYVKWQY